MKQESPKKNSPKKKVYVKPEAKVTKIALGVWAGSSCGSCLSPYTLISTPKGQVKVKNLKVGDVVYTQTKAGKKISMPIIKKSKVKVTSLHKMVYLNFSNGNDLIASPDHPATRAKKIRELFPSEAYDQTKINSVSLINYDHSHTYDILPDGDTGYYWANNILIGSTLTPQQVSPIAKAFQEVELLYI